MAADGRGGDGCERAEAGRLKSVLTESQLDERLEQWRQEYGWGGMPRCASGGSIFATLIRFQGFVPGRGKFPSGGSKTIADEVNDGVTELLSAPEPGEQKEGVYYRAGMVIRAHYLTPYDWPETERLEHLRREGLDISRFTYQRLLAVARMFLAGYLAAKAKPRMSA